MSNVQPIECEAPLVSQAAEPRSSDVLRDALALIPTPHRWCKEAVALARDGTLALPGDRAAVRRCSMGAVDAVVSRPYCRSVGLMLPGEHAEAHWRYERALAWLCRALPDDSDSVAWFNDRYNTRHKDVVALFHRAIALAEAAGD